MDNHVLITDYLWFQEGPGVRNTQYTTDGVKLLNVANFVDGNIDLTTSSRYISDEEAYGKYKHFLVDEGDFLIASSGIQVDYFEKKMGFIRPEQLPLCMNTSTIRFKNLKPDELDMRYFMYYLKSNAFKNQLAKYIVGSAQLNFGPSHLKKMTFPVVEIKRQKYIVENLEKIYTLIALRKEQLVKLDQLVKSRFIELFGDMAHKSDKVFLEELSDFVTVGIANSATHAYADDGIVMLRNQNIKENYLDDNDLIHITPEFAKKYGSKQLEENDILVIRTGYPGVACLVPKKYEGCQTFTTLIVRLKEASLAHANYVCHYINSRFGKDYVEQSKVGVAQQNFGAKALAKMPIVVPPMELQEQFAAFVEQTNKSKLAIQQSLDKLETLKKSLMQEYFG